MPYLNHTARQTNTETGSKMYAQDIKTIQINDSIFHLTALDGVPTWCYASGAIITNADTLALIQANA